MTSETEPETGPRLLAWGLPGDPAVRVIRKVDYLTSERDIYFEWCKAAKTRITSRSPHLDWLREVQRTTDLKHSDITITQLHPKLGRSTSGLDLDVARLKAHVEYGIEPSTVVLNKARHVLETETGDKLYFAYRLTGEGQAVYHHSITPPKRRRSWMLSTSKGQKFSAKYGRLLQGKWDLELIGMRFCSYQHEADQWLDDLQDERILS